MRTAVTYRLDVFGFDGNRLDVRYFQEWHAEQNGDREMRSYAERCAREGFWAGRTFYPPQAVARITYTVER